MFTIIDARYYNERVEIRKIYGTKTGFQGLREHDLRTSS